MADNDRALLIDKCAEILYAALVDIRNASYQPGHESRVNDLADIVHNLPRFMAGRDEFGADHLEESLEAFGRKHGRADRYLMILRMPRDEFDSAFRRTDWSWPEPAEVAGA